MWPLETNRARRRQRRYDCAIALFAADFTYAQLEASERTRVETKLRQLLVQSGDTPAEHKRWAPWQWRMAFIAEAMCRLGVEPATVGLKWPRFVGSANGVRVANWALDYRSDDEATRAAVRFMKDAGTFIDRNPLDQRYIEPDGIPRVPVTVREWYLRRARKGPSNNALERAREE